jgi:hypothetical protein
VSFLRAAAALVLAFGAPAAARVPAARVPAASPGDAGRIFAAFEDVPLRPGLPVVLVFFSTACPACWDDLFAVRLLIEECGFDCELVGVTRDPEPEVRAFLDKYGFAGFVVRDARKRLFRAHGIELEPAAVALEAGRVVYKDDPYLEYPKRRKELRTWMMRRSGRRISV